MQFTTEVGQLRTAVDNAAKPVPKNPSQAVFAGIRLKVTDHLSVTGSDEGETTVTTKVAATGLQPGQKLLIPKPLQTYLATLPATKAITITANNTPDLTVQPENGHKYTFRLMEGVTFPNPVTPDTQPLPTDLTRLPEALRAVKPAVARNKIIQLHSTPNELHLQTTDNYRIVRAILPEGGFGDFTGLLPLNVLEQMGEYSPTHVAPDARGRLIAVMTNTTEVTSRLIAENFPNIAPTLDAPQPFSVTLPKNETLKALTRLNAVADNHPVVFRLNSRLLTLSTASDNVGTGEETIDLDTPAPVETTIGLTLAFAKDALASHESPTITLAWSDPHQAIYLTSTDPFPITTVVMPIRLPPHYLP